MRCCARFFIDRAYPMTRSDRPLSPRSRRPGFTLIELLVALLVAAIVLLGGRLMLEGVTDGAKRLSLASGRGDADASAEQLVRRTVAAMDLSTDPNGVFSGDDHHATFTSWCDNPGGWQERCAVTIAITSGRRNDDGDRATLVLGLPGMEAVAIRTGFKRGALRYLVDAHDNGSWVQRWDAGLSAPVALAATMDSDTLIFRVGAP